MKKTLIGLLALGSISTFADVITCTVVEGENIEYLPTTVILNTKATLSESGEKDYLEFEGLTNSGRYYTGGRAFFGDLGLQIAYEVKKYSRYEIILKESDEFRSDVYTFNLRKNTLEAKIKHSKLPFFPKIHTLSKASYSCQKN
jgi:hypothetical protein